MTKIKEKQKKILKILFDKGPLSSSEIWRQDTEKEVSLVTIKRYLKQFLQIGLVESEGSGRAVVYSLSIAGRVLFEIEASAYCALDPDKRPGRHNYNFRLFSDFPKNIFSQTELSFLDSATELYRHRKKELSPVLKVKELERLIIELSWKSSKIEGNTYNLIDTEKLIKENKVAPGKSQDETRMILNHKEAFEFIFNYQKDFKNLTRSLVENVHKILVKDLGVPYRLRRQPVGVTGSIYRPLDNEYQIKEALDSLIQLTNRLESPYDKALAFKAGLAYIQPFEDGNKRTSRLLANALLLARDLAPLSYRSVDEQEYKDATLVFYETNSIVPFKKIFLTQYIFAANNYAI